METPREVIKVESVAARRTSPFDDLKTTRGAVWLEPRLRCEVSYAAGGRCGSRNLATQPTGS
jgi:hypothetical protein